MNGEERQLLDHARMLMRDLVGDRNAVKFSVIAASIDRELGEIARVQPPRGMQEEAAARYVAKKTTAARKRLAQQADDLIEVARHSPKYRPKYKNIEFKCLDDYEKCRRHRGKYDLLCILSYIVCIGRRIIPFVRQR